MYMGYKAAKAIHEQRVRELLEASQSHESLFHWIARLRRRIAVRKRHADPKVLYSEKTSKSVEQTS